MLNIQHIKHNTKDLFLRTFLFWKHQHQISMIIILQTSSTQSFYFSPNSYGILEYFLSSFLFWHQISIMITLHTTNKCLGINAKLAKTF